MIDYCPDCGHRYTQGHFSRCPASGLATESLDSDPKPHVHKVIEAHLPLSGDDQ
jgi:hypothetical protein